jgi:protein SCO1
MRLSTGFISKSRIKINRARASHVSLSLLLLFCVVVVSACQPRTQPPKAATGRRYELKGKVVRVEKDRHQVVLDHEEIPGYMEAMIMPYTIKDDQILAELAPGDQLHATLVVDADSSWLEDISFTHMTPDDAAANKADTPHEPKSGDAVPNFSLVNQDAKPIRLDRYRGKALLLTFIYTRCPLPEYCTLMSNNFAQIDKELQKNAALYDKTHLLSVSFDPAYDTPKVLRSYGAAHTGNYTSETFKHWEFATGTPQQIKEIAQFFGLTYSQEKDQIAHSLRTVVITPDGKVYKIYRSNDWKPEEVLSDLRTLLNSGA